MKQTKRILAIRPVREMDIDPDPSYLEQEGFESRLAEYRNGQFAFIGVRVAVVSLVGRDLAGMRANVTAPEHRYQYRDGVGCVRNLKKAEWIKEGGHTWLRLTWHPEQRNNHENAYDCGFSGHRDDGDWQNWTVEIVD